MPKTLRISLANVADWDNLIKASYQAAKGKRNRAAVVSYFDSLEQSIKEIQHAILAGRLYAGTYHAFEILDPKPRIIHAAPFEDRVIHHALINCIGARLEKSWMTNSFACRQGYGTHRALECAAGAAKHFNFIVKLDVQAYFSNIDHHILLALLRRQLRDGDLFELLKSILTSHGAEGVGIPIGALTSQYFANHYLDGFDRWLSQDETVGTALRYMDDVLVFTNSLAHAKRIVEQSRQWLLDERSLKIKPAIIQRCDIGVTFCGFKVSSKGLSLSKRRKRSYLCKSQLLTNQVINDEILPLAAQQRACTLSALCKPGNHVSWKKLHQHFSIEC